MSWLTCSMFLSMGDHYPGGLCQGSQLGFSVWGCLSGGLTVQWISVEGVPVHMSLSRALHPGQSLSWDLCAAVSAQGSLSRVGHCPHGSLSRRIFCPWGSLSWGCLCLGIWDSCVSVFRIQKEAELSELCANWLTGCDVIPQMKGGGGGEEVDG